MESKYTIFINFYRDCYFVDFPLLLPFPRPLPLPLPRPPHSSSHFFLFSSWTGFRNNRGWILLLGFFIDKSHGVLQPPKILFVCNAFFFSILLLDSIRVWHNQTHLQATSNKDLLPYFVFFLPMYLLQYELSTPNICLRT